MVISSPRGTLGCALLNQTMPCIFFSWQRTSPKHEMLQTLAAFFCALSANSTLSGLSLMDPNARFPLAPRRTLQRRAPAHRAPPPRRSPSLPKGIPSLASACWPQGPRGLGSWMSTRTN